LVEDPDPPLLRISNARVVDANLVVGAKQFRLVSPLRLAIEDFGAKGALAFLVSDRTFAGFGADKREAVADLMDLITNDLDFYDSKSNDELTEDARQAKAMLLGHFERTE